MSETAGNAERLLGTDTMENETKQPANKGWYHRGYLPHRDDPELLQMVTYHLADSLPKDGVERLYQEIQSLPPEKQDIHRRKQVEAWVDAGHGSCILRNPKIAALVIENWRRYTKDSYDLISWVVMPNHVHVLIRMNQGVSLAKIVQRWKGFTGKKINEFTGNAERPLGTEEGKAKQTLGVPGRVWHREYWDRYIRDERHFRKAVEYIHQNPVNAGLVAKAEDWPWSSAGESTAGNAERLLGSGRNAKQTLGVPSVKTPKILQELP